MFHRRYSLKSARLRARRRKIVIGKVAFAAMCLVGLWGLTFWLSGLPAINVRDVRVFGAEAVSADDIASAVDGLLSGRYLFTIPRASIFFYPKRDIVSAIIKKFPRVETAAAGLMNFHTLGITVTERLPVALWCENIAVEEAATLKASSRKIESCNFMDKNGFIFGAYNPDPKVSKDAARFFASNHSPAVIKFYSTLASTTLIGQTYTTPSRLQSLLTFARNIESFTPAVVAFRERPDGAEEAELTGGVRLIFAPDADFAQIISNLQAVVLSADFGGLAVLNKIDYIDLRFGNKVVYKPK